MEEGTLSQPPSVRSEGGTRQTGSGLPAGEKRLVPCERKNGQNRTMLLLMATPGSNRRQDLCGSHSGIQLRDAERDECIRKHLSSLGEKS